MSADPFEDGDTGPLPGIGHNQGPSAGAMALDLGGRLLATYKAVKDRWAAAVEHAKTVPPAIENEEDAKTATDLVSLIKAITTELDRNREQEKEPFLAGGRQVDMFFGGPKDKHVLTGIARDIERRLGSWLTYKANKERREREERERQEREAAERAFATAMEAQRRETEAATAAAAAEAAAAAAAMDLEAAGQAVTNTANEYRGGQQALASARAAGEPADIVAAENRLKVLESQGKAARARYNELLDAKQAAERQQAAADRAAAAAAEQTAQALDTAAATEASANKLAKAAAAPVAELSRTRGNFGQSGLRRTWTHGDKFDRDLLDLETLRAHLPEDGINQAIRSFIKAGGRNLKGASIYEDTTAVVR